MNLFLDYVQPLTNWLQDNPRWFLCITVLISLTESLAVIGSIVPGSVAMTAIGVLAGSGVMRIDLTLLAAILGAVLGDSLSYALGYYYSERLVEIWPFKKYPKWLHYGKEFFAIHGGKSVLIGRFIGPLRSIIPVIAGILHMKQWRFFLANVLSAVGWSFLYVMPGVVIGAASHELSTESAARLLVLILLLLVVVWWLGFILKWVIRRLSSILRVHLHDLWMTFKNNSFLLPIYNAFTPKNEINHYPTAFLMLLTLSCLLSVSIVLGVSVETQWFQFIDSPIHFFFQSFNSPVIKTFFIFCTQLSATITLGVFFLLCCGWFIYYKNRTALYYLVSLSLCSSGLALVLSCLMKSPRPPGLLAMLPGFSFPAVHLEVATALYGFVLFYNHYSKFLFTNALKSIVLTVLGLSGLGAIYLGDYWFSEVLAAYFAGAVLSVIHCLMYRKSFSARVETLIEDKQSQLMVSLLFISIILSACLSTSIYLQTLRYNHTPYHKKFNLSETTWWQQEKPMLPIYQFSRMGKKISLLNLQFAGDLNLLQANLEKNGWVSQSTSFFNNLLMRMNKEAHRVTLPLLTQLYENKAPILMMTYTSNQPNVSLELRLWESNYHLSQCNKPLWIGSMHSSIPAHKKLDNLRHYLFIDENYFRVRQLKLLDSMIKATRYPTEAYIILVKSRDC